MDHEFPELCNVQTGAESFMVLAQKHHFPRWRHLEENILITIFVQIPVSFCILIKLCLRAAIWNFNALNFF